MSLGLWRVISIEVFLTIGYDALVKSSMRITEEILRQWGSADATFHILWGDGPLKYLIPTLSSLLTTESQESNALETTKSKQEPKMVHLPFSTPRPTSSEGGERPSTPTEMQQRPPQSCIRRLLTNEQPLVRRLDLSLQRRLLTNLFTQSQRFKLCKINSSNAS